MRQSSATHKRDLVIGLSVAVVAHVCFFLSRAPQSPSAPIPTAAEPPRIRVSLIAPSHAMPRRILMALPKPKVTPKPVTLPKPKPKLIPKPLPKPLPKPAARPLPKPPMRATAQPVSKPSLAHVTPHAVSAPTGIIPKSASQTASEPKAAASTASVPESHPTENPSPKQNPVDTPAPATHQSEEPTKASPAFVHNDAPAKSDGDSDRDSPFVGAEPKYHPQPKYPTAARRMGQTGVVVLLLEIDDSGRVSSVSIKQSSGYSALDQSALDTVRGWQFTPAHRGKTEISARKEQAIRFNLD